MRFYSYALLVVPALAVFACGSSPSADGSGSASEGASASAVSLGGTYVASDASTAPFASITFVDATRYILQPTSCPTDQLCREQGTYTTTDTDVTLQDDIGDPPETYPLAILDSGELPDGVDSALDVGVDGLVSGSGSLTVSASSRRRAYSVRVAQSSYQLVSSSGSLVTSSNASSLLTPTPAAGSGTVVGSSIVFEGSCNFLESCSSYSKSLPAGEVSWGCVGVKVCSDTDHWLAAPSNSYCGKTVTVCNGSKCTTGTVLDVSSGDKWEGSEGLLGAIGISYGLVGTCSGYGGGTVKITD